MPQTDGADQSGLFRDIRATIHTIAADRCKGLSANLVIGEPNVKIFCNEYYIRVELRFT